MLHLDLKTVNSYGDQLLFELVRQTFNSFGGGGYFDVTESHPFRERATEAWVDQVNENFDGVVIGGGGIFPPVQRRARLGLQWNITTEILARLKKPVIVFGAGNPPDFDADTYKPVFRTHVNQTMKQSIFFGLRSTGAVDAMREYSTTRPMRRWCSSHARRPFPSTYCLVWSASNTPASGGSACSSGWRGRTSTADSSRRTFFRRYIDS